MKNNIKKNLLHSQDKIKKGFILLFAVMLSSIILAVSLGVANIATKESKFATSAKNTNEAFFAADVGAECALYNDKTTINKFPVPGAATAISSCVGQTPTPTLSNSTATTATYTFIISSLGPSGQGCANITVAKNTTTSPSVIITSRGYNLGGSLCNSTSTNLVERQLEVKY